MNRTNYPDDDPDDDEEFWKVFCISLIMWHANSTGIFVFSRSYILNV